MLSMRADNKSLSACDEAACTRAERGRPVAMAANEEAAWQPAQAAILRTAHYRLANLSESPAV